jgi:hypothetical protein
MTTATAPVTMRGDLPANATYSVRTWVWVPGGTRREPKALGALTIVQRRSPKAVTTEADVYTVCRSPSNAGYDLEHLVTGDLYACVPGEKGYCTCPAGRSGQVCKHLQALDAILAERGL